MFFSVAELPGQPSYSNNTKKLGVIRIWVWAHGWRGVSLCEEECVTFPLCQQPWIVGQGSEFTLWYFSVLLFPPNSQPVFLSASEAVSLFICLLHIYRGEKRRSTNVESNTTVSKKRERRNEEKAYYQQTDGPPFHSGPTGTRRDNSLHLRVSGAAEREGHLNTTLCVCILFVNL